MPRFTPRGHGILAAAGRVERPRLSIFGSAGAAVAAASGTPSSIRAPRAAMPADASVVSWFRRCCAPLVLRVHAAEIEHGELLRLMRMVGTGIDMQVAHGVAASGPRGIMRSTTRPSRADDVDLTLGGARQCRQITGVPVIGLLGALPVGFAFSALTTMMYHRSPCSGCRSACACRGRAGR